MKDKGSGGHVHQKRRRSQVQHKRMLKRYMIIALIMGTVGFLLMVIEEVIDYKDEPSATSAFSDDVQPPSIFSSGADGKKKKGEAASQNLSTEQMKKMKQAAEMLGIIK